MVKIPNDGQNQGLLPRVFEAYQVGSKPASWILGIAGGIFLGSVFFLVPDPTNAQCGILRFFMSLIGGLFFLFFVGGLVLEGKMKGFTVGAGGGAAVFFLLQFGVNPIPNCGKVNAVKGVEWSNGRELGQLGRVHTI